MAKSIEIYSFSATHVTLRCAEAMRDELASHGNLVQLNDITPHAVRMHTRIPEKIEGLIFGLPVFADFPPRVLREWFSGLEGGRRPCAVFCTYGGRTPGYTLYDAWSLLTESGFRVVCLAEILGRHTFNLAGWKMIPDRPNAADYATARAFAALAADRFAAGSSGLSLQKPFGYERALANLIHTPVSMERKWTQPVRFKPCTQCGKCEAECPTAAITAEHGISDPEKCIECLHCVYICPDGALKANDNMRSFYPIFLKEWNLSDHVMSRKQSRIVPNEWEAVC